MLSNKKVIIFDLDGTLIDSVGVWNYIDKILISQITTKQKINLHDLRHTFIQSERDRILREQSETSSPYLEYCMYLKLKYVSNFSLEEIHNMRYKIAQHYLRTSIDYKPNADIFLHKLKELGYTLVLASTTKRCNIDIYRTENHNIMAKANFDDFFSLIYSRDDVQKIKPHPEVFLTILDKLGSKPRDCIIFEDSLVGIEAANQAGIENIAIYDSHSKNDWEELIKISTFNIKSFCDVLRQL